MNGTNHHLVSSQKFESRLRLSFPLTLCIPSVIKYRQYHPHISPTHSLFSIPTATACFSSSLRLSRISETISCFFSLPATHHTATRMMRLNADLIFVSPCSNALVIFPINSHSLVWHVTHVITSLGKRLLSFLDACPTKLTFPHRLNILHFSEHGMPN